MKTVTVHHAKAHLSRLLKKAAEGEEIVIAKGAVPVARLVPISGDSETCEPENLKGKLRVERRFFAPLPGSELAAWEE